MYKSGKRIDVLFLIEHKDRELDNISAIGAILENKYNLNVAIGSIYYHSLLALLTVKPKILVVPYSNGEQDFPLSIFWKVYGEEIIYVNMNLEQILHKNNLEYKRPRDYFSKNILKQICWGDSYKEYLLESGVALENIRVTGNPAITLLKDISNGRDIKGFKEEIAKKYKLPIYKRWMFFPMNDGWAFMDDESVKRRIQQGYNEKNAWEYKRFMKAYIDIIIDWIIRLEKQYPQKDFIIVLRPHPSVSIEKYKALLKEKLGTIPKWLFLNREMTVKEWLVVSDSCFTTFSTVALDTNRIGKKAVLMTPLPLPDFIKMDWMDILENVTTFEEFSDALYNTNHENNIDISNILDRYVKSDVNAVVEVGNYIAQLNKSLGYPQSHLLKAGASIFLYRRRTLGTLIRLMLIKFNMHFETLLPKGLIQDYFTKTDVRDYYESYIFNESKNINNNSSFEDKEVCYD